MPSILTDYAAYLHHEERSENTISNYLHDIAAIQTGRAVVDCKDKNRTIFLPKDLCRSLTHYCREQGIKDGVIFCTKTGKPLDRSYIWRDMQALCKGASVEPGKVFPPTSVTSLPEPIISLKKTSPGLPICWAIPT